MAKVTTEYICSSCGAKAPQMIGRCPVCGEWGTYEEALLAPQGTRYKVQGTGHVGESVKPMKIQEVQFAEQQRIDMHNAELNRVLGGGLVPGSLVLLGGEPGIGKSTLALQVLMQMGDKKALYASGEESVQQLRLRAERLKGNPDNLYVVSETHLEQIFEYANELQPDIVIVDSIQTISTDGSESSVGSLSQVKECAVRILDYAKSKNIPFLIVGHITKEGSLAGPKVLEHIVDTVLQFEGDQHYMYRILRAQKNRFGSTSEIGIFEMQQDGLREVSNPSELLLSTAREGLSGIAIAAAVEGMRPFLIEVQALVSTAAYGTPQRSSTGFDSRRLNMLLAVLEKRVGFKLAQKDVFVNIAGGLRVNDPAIDLSVMAAVLSSNMDIAMDADTCLCGEVGLAGEIRPVNRLEQRIKEAEKLGFKRIIVPKGQKISLTGTNIEIVKVGKVAEAFKRLITIFLLLITTSLGVFAQQDHRPYKMELGLQGGCGYYVGDAMPHIFNHVREAYGLQYRFKFDPRWSLALTGMQHTYTGLMPDGNSKWLNHSINIDATAEFNFFRFGEKQYDTRYKPITPFIFVGIGAGLHGQNWDLNRPTGYVPLGFGLKWKFAERFGLNVKWQHNIYFTDDLEGQPEWNNTHQLNGHNWFNCDVTSQLTVGLVVEFVKTKKICRTCER